MRAQALFSAQTPEDSREALLQCLNSLMRAQGDSYTSDAAERAPLQDPAALLQAALSGELEELGPYGRPLLTNLLDEPGLRAAARRLAARPGNPADPRAGESAPAHAALDASGRIGRSLLLLECALAHRSLKLPSHLLFAEYPTHRFNAAIVSTPHGDLCLLNTGLLRLLFHASVAANHAYSDDGRLGLPDSPQLKHAAALVHTVIAQYLQHGLHAHVLPTQGHLPQEGLYDATALALAMRLFVLAHEVAHVVLGHDQRPAPLSALQETPDNTAIARSHDDEFAADAFAQDLLLAMDECRLLPEAVVGGGLAFLMLHALVLEVASRLSGSPVAVLSRSESHPPTWERIRRLDEQLAATTAPSARQGLERCVLFQRLLLTFDSLRFADQAGAPQSAPGTGSSR